MRARFGGGFFQAAAVPGHRLFDVPGEVVIQVPAVSDLDRVRGALPCAVGVGAGPVPADHLGSGVLAQPVCEGVRLAVVQQVHRLAGLRVDQDGAVVPAAAEREIIHAQDLHGPGLGAGQGHDQPQQAGPSRGQVQQGGQPRSGPPGQGQRDPGEHARQRRGAPGAPRGQAFDLLGEGDRGAVRVTAEEAAHREPDDHRLAAHRRVRQPPPVRAVHPARCLAAPRAHGLASAGTGPQAQAARQLGGFHDDPGQVRQQPLQADLMLA